ncbi:MAG: C4-dicarboxylate ABC transporter permease [Geminicoccaceae bacterium]|nr:MAG: C4-dicarboxylate ABC transporter permease [Geminicoccaceae bacterium]
MSAPATPGPRRAAADRLEAGLDAWLALARRIARPVARAGGLLILAAAFLVAAEVLLRGLFAVSLGGADELSGYALAIATSWGLAWVLVERGHVRVDALYTRLPGRLVALLDLLALLVLTGFLALLGQRAGLVLAESLAFDSRATTPLATPLWIPQSLWVAGFALHLLVAVPLTLRAGLALLRGDRATVQRLAGSRTLAEEAAAERRGSA